jgi:antitoxin component of MazEF toxin-antitoxin module
MLYPFFTEADGIRDYLIREKVFIPQFWLNVLNWTSKNSFEYKLVNNLILLPIDQRYSLADMKRVIDLVERFIADR